MEKFDILVVGSGTGKNIASRAAGEGLRVALVDRDTFGGTCLLRGCVPSKTMIYPADVIQEAREADILGVNIPEIDIDFQKIMERTRDSYQDKKDRLLEAVRADENTVFYNDVGRFVDDYTMEVGDETIKADKIVLFSGSRPIIPPIDGIGETEYWTNRTIFDINEKPDNLVIIGGGYIGVEFAHFFSAVGTEVTLIEMMDSLLPGREPKFTELLEEKLSKRMKVLTNHKVTEVGENKDKKFVKAENSAKGEGKELEADAILLAVGRRSNADLLDVENTSVETDENDWIKVDEHLETSKENIWAGGDATGKHMFKHIANYEASVVWHNAFTDHEMKTDYHAVPYAVFTRPQMAGVGMSVEEAKEDHNVLVTEGEYKDTARGYAMGDPDGFCKIIVDKDNGRILGAHIIGPHASVLVQEITNLMSAGHGTIDPLYDALHIHPSLSEVVTWSLGNWREV